MKRKILLFIYGLFITFLSLTCAKAQRNSQDFSGFQRDFEKGKQKYNAGVGDITNPTKPIKFTNYTIPVVFHVIKTVDNPNFFLSPWAIDKIRTYTNEDLKNQHPNVAKLPTHFAKLAKSAGVDLCLAKKDKEDVATQGINYYDVKNFDPNKDLMQNVEALLWPQDKYLNVVFLEFPTDQGDKYKNWVGGWQPVKDYILFNSSSLPFREEFPIVVKAQGKKSRLRYLAGLLCHEFGHKCGLWHPWGVEEEVINVNCTSNDNLDDTPNQYEPSPNNKDLTYPRFDNCTKEDKKNPSNISNHGVMFYTFMDHAQNMCMFSEDQADVIQAYMAKSTLINSKGCEEGSCLFDQYEPNDFDFEAEELGTIDSGKSKMFSAILCKGDNDYFSFKVKKPYNHVKITLAKMPADYDLGFSYENDKNIVLDESTNLGQNKLEVLVGNNLLEDTDHLVQIFSLNQEYNNIQPYYFTIQGSTTAYPETRKSRLNQGDINLQPNPASSVLNINLSNIKATKLQLEVIDSYGNVQLRELLQQPTQQHTLNIKSLKTGLYILKLTGDNVNESLRFVVE